MHPDVCRDNYRREIQLLSMRGKCANACLPRFLMKRGVILSECLKRWRSVSVLYRQVNDTRRVKGKTNNIGKVFKNEFV